MTTMMKIPTDLVCSGTPMLAVAYDGRRVMPMEFTVGDDDELTYDIKDDDPAELIVPQGALVEILVTVTPCGRRVKGALIWADIGGLLIKDDRWLQKSIDTAIERELGVDGDEDEEDADDGPWGHGPCVEPVHTDPLPRQW